MFIRASSELSCVWYPLNQLDEIQFLLYGVVNAAELFNVITFISFNLHVYLAV